MTLIGVKSKYGSCNGNCTGWIILSNNPTVAYSKECGIIYIPNLVRFQKEAHEKFMFEMKSGFRGFCTYNRNPKIMIMELGNQKEINRLNNNKSGICRITQIDIKASYIRSASNLNRRLFLNRFFTKGRYLIT